MDRLAAVKDSQSLTLLRAAASRVSHKSLRGRTPGRANGETDERPPADGVGARANVPLDPLTAAWATVAVMMDQLAGAQSAQVWLDGCDVDGTDRHGRAVIRAPSMFKRDWLRNNFAPQLDRAWQMADQRDCVVVGPVEAVARAGDEDPAPDCAIRLRQGYAGREA